MGGSGNRDEALNVLELFAGAGGGIQAAGLLGHRVVCAVEKDAFCREVLMARQEDGTTPPFPIWDDARTFDGKPWRGTVDVVSAGFPCQPFSEAGKQKADKDERNLWPDTLRIIRDVRPRIVFLENVPRLVRLYLPRVLGDLAESGYDAEWCVLGAEQVGAPHSRKRLWIYALAHADSKRGRGGNAGRKNAADAGEPPGSPRGYAGRVVPWNTEPAVGRVANGVAHRVDRLAALGNGQVPQCYAAAWRLLEQRMST